MLTLHAADLVEPGGGQPPVAGGAVLVDGERIAAVGPLAELEAAHPGVRVRRWAGTLRPALVHDGPLPAAPTPRERVHALLRLGVGSVPSHFVPDPEDRAAAGRAGLHLVAAGAVAGALRSAGRADFAVFSSDGLCLATTLSGRLLHRLT